MMRRGFWLFAGAVLGVAGYRKATRLARTIAGTPAAPSALAPGGRAIEARVPVPLSARIGSATSFARDVRAGMADYRDLHRRQLGRSLDTRNPGQSGDRSLAGRGSIEP